MSDFKAGDEVYVRGEVRRTDYDDDIPFVVHIFNGTNVNIIARKEYLIPASRVTIAPARRAARMPEDFGKDVYFSNDGKTWLGGKLCGWREGDKYSWVSRDFCWQLCEVEE